MLVTAVAEAAPADVPLTASATGTTLTHDSSADIFRQVAGKKPGADPRDGQGDLALREDWITPGTQDFVYSDVPDGTYVLHWACAPGGPFGEVTGGRRRSSPPRRPSR